MRYRFIISIFVLLISAYSVTCRADAQFPPTLDRALKSLDKALENRQDKIDEVNGLIDSLRRELSAPGIGYNDEILLLEQIAGAFRHIQVDSACAYSERAIALSRENGDSARAMRLYLNQIDILPLRGYVHEALMRIDSVSTMSLDSDLKRSFFKNARSALLCITSLYSPHALNDSYFERYVAYNDSLLSVTPEDVPEHKLYLGCHYLGSNQLSLAMATLSDYLESIDMSNACFGDAAANLAIAQFIRGRMDLWLYFLTLNAHFEVVNGYTDGEALRQISPRLYERGDVNRAYSYLFTSQEDIA